MHHTFLVDRAEVQSTSTVTFTILALIIVGNGIIALVPEFRPVQLCALVISCFFLLLLTAMVPLFYNGRFEKLTISENAFALVQSNGVCNELRFDDVVEVVWNGRHSRVRFSCSRIDFLVPLTGFKLHDRLRIIHLLHSRLPESSQKDWGEFCRTTAVPLFHSLTNRYVTGEKIPQRIPKPEPKFEQVKLSRKECVCELWKACRFTNLFMLATVAIAAVNYLIAQGLANQLDWVGFAKFMAVLAAGASLMVWGIGALFLPFISKDGREVKRKIKTEPVEKEPDPKQLGFYQIISLVVSCSVIAGLLTWLFYWTCCDVLGFLQQESAIASMFVFLFAYIGAVVAISCLTEKSLSEERALNIWADEASTYLDADWE